MENPILLVDFTLMCSEEEDVMDLAKLCQSASFCMVAMSSGSGSSSNDSRRKESLKLIKLEFEEVKFLPFNKNEAVTFVRVTERQVYCLKRRVYHHQKYQICQKKMQRNL